MNPSLLADSEWVNNLISAMSNNGLWVFLSVCVLAGVGKHISAQFLRHRERLMMIENGMHPDAKHEGLGEQPEVVPLDREELGETADYRGQRHA